MLVPLRATALVGLAALALPSLVSTQGTSSLGASSQATRTATNSQASLTSAATNATTSATVTFTDIPSIVPVLTTRSISRSVSSVQTLSSVATVIRVSYTLTPSTTASATTSSTPSATSTPSIHLATRVDPTFGVLGVLLILTGLPTAFWGHKNRWSSFFLVGFYTLALTTIVLILKFGVLDAINPPSRVVRGMFLLASAVAGVIGGGLSIFFWKHTKYFIGAWGGFALALWIQCFREGGVIRPVGFRWIFYVACAVVGFILCTIPRIHYNILLISTALVGASATILGVDCFTTAGLKEFYIWNLGFMRLFPVFHDIGMPYPLYQTEQIELGLIAAVALMGGAVQFRVLGVLKNRLREINEEQRKREEDAEIAAAERFDAFDDHLEEWEKRHGNRVSTAGKDASGSDTPTPTALTYDGRPSSQFSLLNGFKDATPTRGDYSAVPLQSPKAAVVMPEPAAGGISGRPQSIGALPTLDLGTDDLAGGAGGVRRDSVARMEDAIEDAAAQRRREELLAEIQSIKKNIAQLKAEGVSNSSGSRPASTAAEPSRSRTVSFDALRTPVHVEAPQESEWDRYVRDRKLFTPPSGVTPPIPSGTINGRPIPVALPEAVAEAVETRRQRESMLEMGKLDEVVASAPPKRSHNRSKSNPVQPEASTSSSPGQRGRDRPTHSHHHSQGPPVILPPRKSMSPGPGADPRIARPARVKTWEEMQERHRRKMRELQEPLRRAEAELADLENARSRWERSQQVERQVMARREAERKAAFERKQAEEAAAGAKKGKRFSKLFGGAQAQPQVENREEEVVETEEEVRERPRRHGRRDSAALKVTAWQAFQEQTVESGSGRRSRDAPRQSVDGARRRSSDTRHRQSTGPIVPHHPRQPSGYTPRDAPN
ncbi:hypothetical protein FRC10_003420 [Ceratobasidium sp. 414]|nr:hypothetical protein FRC10_003420 [Ceratobasidium sp. 414]